MSQLTIHAFFRAKPGRTQALGTALSALVDPTRAEPERLNYDLHQPLDDADVWIVHENWRSGAGTLGKIAVTVDPEVGHQEARLPWI